MSLAALPLLPAPTPFMTGRTTSDLWEERREMEALFGELLWPLFSCCSSDTALNSVVVVPKLRQCLKKSVQQSKLHTTGCLYLFQYDFLALYLSLYLSLSFYSIYLTWGGGRLTRSPPPPAWSPVCPACRQGWGRHPSDKLKANCLIPKGPRICSYELATEQ